MHKARRCISDKHDDPQKRRDRLSGKLNCGRAVESRMDKFADDPWVVHQIKPGTAASVKHQGHNYPLSKEDVAHSIQLLALDSEHKNNIEEGALLGHKISTVMDTLRETWPDMTFEYRSAFKEFQKAQYHKKQQTLDLSGFSEAADLLKLLGERERRTHLGARATTTSLGSCGIFWQTATINLTVFITNQDTGMESALKSVMPESDIVNCLWHVTKNLENVAGARRKQEAKRRKSTLDDVLVTTEERTVKKNLNHEELDYRRRPPHSRWRIKSTVDNFHEIVTENNRFLGGFAQFKMVDEMTEFYFYRVMETELADLESLQMMMSKTISKTLQRTINKVVGKTMAIKMRATVEMKDKKWTTLCPTSIVSSRQDNVKAVYCVEYGKKKRRQLLFLLKDREFFCSYLRPQSTGIVCRHFFAVMRVHSSPLRYHISLILRRWFREEFQFNSHWTSKTEPSLDCTDKSGDEYMERVRKMTVKDMSSSSAELEEAAKDCRRYEVAKDIYRFMRQQTSFSEADNNIFSQCIEEAKRKLQASRAGVSYVEDPNMVTSRGRPRSKWLKPQAEIASERASKKFKVHALEFN
ncbi:hypothetical protein BGZ47_003419, partial [Haplosporangium gracile]